MQLFLVLACRDFLEKYPKDLLYAESTADLDELLVGEGYMPTQDVSDVSGDTPIETWIHVMDDDLESVKISVTQDVPYESFFHWQKQPFQTSSGAPTVDNVWSALYERISVVNVVLENIEEFKDEPGDGYNRVKGEAHFLRAGYYFWLVNLYAKPYDRETSSTDPGVPVKLTANIEDKYFSRNPVAEVYNVIVKDLQSAITCLSGIQQPNIYRVNEFAARALLSRVYLYMQEWELVINECNEILTNGAYQLLDFNQLDDDHSIIYASSPETIFSQGEYRTYYLMEDFTNAYRFSDEFIEAFKDKENDLRFCYGMVFSEHPRYPNSAGYYSRKLKQYSDGAVSDCFLIRLAEVYLNKAEAETMLDGKEREAIATLQALRVNRFKTGTLTDVPTSGKELVDFVRNERRLELCVEGHRWFDLRRYAVNTKYPESNVIKHNYWKIDESTRQIILIGYYQLDSYPKDGGYVLPIPNYEIIFNNGLMNNNERPVRDYVTL